MRLTAPKHADLLFAAVLAWSFLAGENGWSRLLMDGDAGVHLRIGDWVREHQAVPTVDLFGFSKPHGEWLAYEWLAGVLFSLAHSVGGLRAMTLLAGVVLALVPVVVAMHCASRGAHGWLTLLLTLIATNALNIHFLARPHIFTLLFLALSAWMLECDRRSPTNRIWLLLPLVALWANLHGGFFILFPLLAILSIESRRYALIGIGCAAASLINPYGWKLHAHVIAYLRSDWVIRFVDEFKSPSFRSETMLCFMLILFAALACAGLLAQRRRWVDALIIAFFSYCALVSVRHVTVFMVVVVPLVAQEISRSIRFDLPEFDFRRLSLWAPALLVAAALWPGVPGPKDFPSDLFPVQLVEKHAARLTSARVFTTDQWADYLIYRNYPRQQVFMDARHNYFGPAIGDEFVQLIHGLPGWKAIVERYRFDAMLLPRGAALNALLEERREWTVLDRDDRALLWILQAPGPPLAARSPFAFLRQDGYPPRDDSPLRIEPASAR